MTVKQSSGQGRYSELGEDSAFGREEEVDKKQRTCASRKGERQGLGVVARGDSIRPPAVRTVVARRVAAEPSFPDPACR